MRITTAAVSNALDGLAPFEGATARELADSELLAAQATAAQLRRAAEAILATVAFEIGRRSTPDAGAASLARSHGFASPTRLIAQTTGGTRSDAARLIAAGRALASDVDEAGLGDAGSDDAGPPAPPSHPLLAKALAAGDIGADAGALILATLDSLGEGAREAEERLVAKARTMDLIDLKRACQWLLAGHNPGAWAEREQRQADARHVSVTEDPEGMVVITAKLDPPSAAPVVAWLDAQVKDALRRRRDHGSPNHGSPDHDPLAHDDRNPGHIRADALVALARHGLGCEHQPTGVTTTVVVRMTLEQLRGEAGLGACDDVQVPFSATALRRMAANAEVIPMVLGGQGEALDVGRARRLFTRAQRLALGERDGGCAMCHAPPSWCDAHHIRWWDRHHGRTDLSNGVLLCVGCHHRVHRDGWDIEVRDGRVWFRAPAAVDPSRTPRPGGRAHFQLAA